MPYRKRYMQNYEILRDGGVQFLEFLEPWMTDHGTDIRRMLLYLL